MKKNQSNLNIPSLDSSRHEASLGHIIYQDEAVFFKTDVRQQERIIIVRPKNLNQRKLGGGAESNQNLDLTSSNELFETIINFLKAAEGVEKILCQKKDEVLRIWTVLAEYDKEEKRKAVYHQEKLLMRDLMSRKYRFDFYIIGEEEVGEIISSGPSLIFDRHCK